MSGSVEDQRVLIVDDNRLSAQLLAATAKREGFLTEVAFDGTQALACIENQAVDILITDWEMPGLTGEELVQRIRDRTEDPYRYIIMVTRHGDLSHRNRGLKAGADDFLGKPVDDAEVTARLRVARRIIAMSRELANQRDEVAATHARLEAQLDQASQVQRTLLPSEVPEIPGWRIDWRVDPCDQLGGDSLGLIPFGGGMLGAYLFDVTGHGVSAALLATQVSRALSPEPRAGSPLFRHDPRSGELGPAPPEAVLGELNRRFQMVVDVPQLVAMSYALFDLGSGRVTWSCAAIPPPYLIAKRGDWQREESVGPFLGMLPESRFNSRVGFLAAGDRMVLTSDGIDEARDTSGRQFGQDRVERFLADAQAIGAEAVADALLAEVGRWQAGGARTDDQAVLVVARDP